MELKGTQLGLKTQADNAKLQADNEREGFRIGADMARNAQQQKEIK
jgi:hypothetical protein